MSFAKKDKERESQPAPLLAHAALGADLPEVVAPIEPSNENNSDQRAEDVEQEETEETEKADPN
jgi:hypothetical protein